LFLGGAGVVQFEEAGEEFLSGLGGDGVAGAVVFGEGFDLLEVVGEVDGGTVGALFVPGVGGEDGLVELAVEVAEVVDGVAGLGLGEAAGGGAVFGRDVCGGLAIAGLGALLEELVEAGVEIGGVEEVVNVGEAEPEAEHEVAAVLVVALAHGDEFRVGLLPLPGGEGEGVEALRRGVAESGFQCPAVFACPDFVDGGLDDGVVIPAVGGEDVSSVCEHYIRRHSCEAEVLRSSRCYKTTVLPFDSS